MKYLIIFLLSISAVSASTEKSITDLMYLPKNNVNYLMSGLRLNTQENISKQAVTGSTVATEDTETITAHIAYGRNIFDNLFLVASLDYEIDSEESTKTTGSLQKTTSSGISDPTFEIKYRALTEAKDKLIFDYKFALSPKLGKAKSASQMQDGNNLRGGSEASVGVEMGRKIGVYSMALEANITYTGEREVTNLTDNSLLRVKNKIDYIMRVKGQYHFDEAIFFGAAMSFNSLGDYDEKRNTGVSKIAYETSVTVYLTAGYKLNTDTVLKLEYRNNSVDREVSLSGNLTNQEITNTSINAFVQYQF